MRETPRLIQADFLFRRMAEQAAQDSSLRDQQPWQAVYEENYAWLSDALTKYYQGDDSDLKVMMAGLVQAYAGSTIEEFEQAAGSSCASASTRRLAAYTLKPPTRR